MPSSRHESLKAQMSESIASRDAIAAGDHPDSGDAQQLARHVAAGLRLSLVAMDSSIGECQQALPYSPLHPVLDDKGEFRWCCNHDPQHCSRP